MRIITTSAIMIGDYEIINSATESQSLDLARCLSLPPLELRLEDDPRYALKPAYFRPITSRPNPELTAALLNVLSRHLGERTPPHWLSVEGPLFPDVSLIGAFINHDGLRLSFIDKTHQRLYEYRLRAAKTANVKLTFCPLSGHKYLYEELVGHNFEDGNGLIDLFHRLPSRIFRVTELGDAGPSGPRKEIYFSPSPDDAPGASELLIKDYR